MHDPAPQDGESEMALVRDKLAGLAAGGHAELLLVPARPTAAFSRRDALLPGFGAAQQVVREHGFAPMLRPVGGHLAVYDEGSLVLHLWAPHPDPRTHIHRRFELLSGAMADALRSLGVDARVGAVPGEYCDGEFSVNASGSAKLIGTGQRITRVGYLFSAVVMVDGAARVRDALSVGYSRLGLEFRPETVGCVADSVPGVTVDDVRQQLLASFADVLTLDPDPALAGSVRSVGPPLRVPA
ncbi:biotin/lipoate A/B protein ligase family protein [Kocuria sp. M4R2S49]|uniref:lipoate--protein ligase family protein n=1 Tax=Kocuria rhizosphaericola TaxID=3376284 RepID=UPI0037A4B494